MKAKFTPIAMRCNEEQFKAIEPKLKDAGLKLNVWSLHDCQYLVNNGMFDNKTICNYKKSDAGNKDRTVYETWNEEIFLNACGIETKIDESAKENQSVKQYKHIPSGKIAEKAEITGCYFVEQDYLPNWLIENSSDWQEVKPKEYEVLSFQYTNEHGAPIVSTRNDNGTFGPYEVDESTFINSPIHKIHSVKRLSDGEVFTVGDFIKQGHNYEITGFHQNYLGYIFIETKDISKVFPPLSRAVKVNKPLFTTQDGKEIFKDQYFWYVTNCFKIREYSADECWTPKIDGVEFSTKELAEEYVLMNSPCLSVKATMKIIEHYTDVVKCWSNEEFKNSIVELAKSKISDQQ